MLKATIYSLRALSVLFFVYTVLIAAFSGIRSSFLWFYAVFSIASAAASFLLPAAFRSPFLPLVIGGKICTAVLWSLLILFLITEVQIIAYTNHVPPGGADYLIVLGAQVRGRTPSLTLQNRIDAAYAYLKENAHTIAICSGGQGAGEDVTEAYAISAALIEKGIPEDRILLEEQSTNTTENINYSRRFLNPETDTVVIATSDFHLYRACKIAKKAGIQNVFGCTKKEFLLTTPGYYIREFIAIQKDRLFGNL